jgi:DhnA family fructose-bisphosphate aldolase class Ia
MGFKTRRLARLFSPDGRGLVVAMDHAGFMDKPLRGLENPLDVIRQVGHAGADSFLLTLGSAVRCAESIGRAGLWLSVDTRPPLLDHIVETALRIGADGVKCMVYPWCAEAPDSLTQFSALAVECQAWGLPLMAEVIPGGFTAGAEMRTADKIAAGARVAMEAGADVVKTVYTGDAESFSAVVHNCSIPIIVLGGERAANDRELLQSVSGALTAGAAGVAIGRNIWQHPQPGRITAALAALIHGDATVDEALAITEEPVTTRAKRGNKSAFQDALAKVANVEPEEEQDKLG